MVTYHIPEHVVFTTVAEECVLLNTKSGEYYSLNPVGTRLFELLKSGSHREEVLQAMLADYEVGEAELAADLDKLVNELESSGLLSPG